MNRVPENRTGDPSRFVYLYADRLPDEPYPEGDLHFIGKLLTANPEVAALIPQLLGATTKGRTVSRIEVGKAGAGAAVDTVHTLTTTRPNDLATVHPLTRPHDREKST